MNESEAQELITSFIEPWKGQQQSNIHDYILQNGVDIAHTPHKWDRGLSLPKDFTGFFYSTESPFGWDGSGPLWLGYIKNGMGITFTALDTPWDDFYWNEWSGRNNSWGVRKYFYDITHLIIHSKQFINWRTDPFEVKS